MTSELSKLLKPKSVAIVGVSKDQFRIGGRLLKYLVKHGYQGELALVNPNYPELNGIKCFPTVSEIPFSVECALIAVPFKHVLPVLEECASNHVGAAVVYSSGFAEMGESGRKVQQQLRELARSRNIRICGPNCIGIVNFNESIALSFSQLLETDALKPGHIGFISQSGALGGSITNRAQDLGIGLSYFISSGNEADLDIADYIKHLALSDDNTTVIAAIIEGFKDGTKFIEAAELALSQRKPLIVLKIGETEIGKKAASSHTGSMTGMDAVVDAALNQKGVIRVRNYDDLFQTASLFSKKRIPAGGRVGILSTSGGAGIIMADHYAKLGIVVPEPSPKTIETASRELSAFGQVANPFDLTGQIFSDPELFMRCLNYFIADENFDIIQINMSMVAGQASVIRAKQLLEVANKSDKPVVVWWAAGSLSDPGIMALADSGVTSFRSPDRCAAAVKALVKYHQVLSPKADATVISPLEFGSIKRDAAKLLASSNACLSEHESKRLLSLYGIPVTQEVLVNSKDEAVRVAAQIGFPVVLKVDSADILHKTEANIIGLNIKSREEVGVAYEQIMANAHRYKPDASINGILVQEMVFGGTETIAGMSQDPQFGPVLAFGLGGIFVEVLKDISLRVIPVSKSDAEDMVKEIKGYSVLKGLRNRARGDLEALVDVLQKLSRLADDFREEISEIDINPLMVLEKGKGVKALDALVIRKKNEEPL